MAIDRQTRKNLTEMFDILSEAFTHIERLLLDGNTAAAIGLLSHCQESAVVIGTSIEKICGEETRTVSMLEQLCEDIFQASEQLAGSNAITSEDSDSDSKSVSVSLMGILRNRLNETIEVFNKELAAIKEIVFLPCSPTLWSGFDYMYRELISSGDCNVTVIPIPWYDKASDGSIGSDSVHYDTEGYPEYVKLTHFGSYDIAAIHPDIIYIQNAFDNSNLGSSLHPAFYTIKLRESCGELIYIPPYIYPEPNIKSKDQLEKLREYLCLPGIDNIDKIILQSENMKQAMLNLLAGEDDSEYRRLLEEKITCNDHPRISAMNEIISKVNAVSDPTNSIEIPDAWKARILRNDGSRKKIILYCNSIPAMLENGSRLISKIKNSFDIFKNNTDDIALIWRPHPMMQEVADDLRPEISDSFKDLVDYFYCEGIGIIDTSQDPAIPVAIADAYYGDPSSVMELFKLTNKPIMIENPAVL
ncbi:hypothetical protein [Butyrivibrio fibrisolvens]|uniref:hypothetical protein n=1 Tax=Butyrivibrio fibrisolvens TaxID=831 RepID=UPI0003B658DA|nr:hypothetical protein [Butyrivibrio fibrisolvens]